jgi:hypothetical protein
MKGASSEPIIFRRPGYRSNDGQRESGHWELPLAHYMQRGATGDEHFQTQALNEQIGHNGRSGPDLFEVIENQEQLPIAQGRDQGCRE